MASMLRFVLFCAKLAAAQQALCYGLDGTKLDSSYAPCSPGAKHSGCCAINRPAGAADICLDSGLCMATSGVFMGTIWQDGCTDPTGQDPGCPKLCPDGEATHKPCDNAFANTVQPERSSAA
jgi:hypothetical protein